MKIARLLFQILALALLLTAAAPTAYAQESDSVQEAARAFSQGQTHYNEGRYEEAIEAFATAHTLAPHPSALFNIARCYENLARVREALEYYGKALAETGDATERADIARRMERLRALPVRVFVSSEPAGARVTVDGRPAPETKPTPTVVELRPGAHVLLVQKDGYQLAARRVEVEPGVEQPVSVRLEPLPEACDPAPQPCTTSCPEVIKPPLDGLHLHLSAGAALGKTTDRSLAPGLAVQSFTTYDHLLFGASLFFLPTGEETIEEDNVTTNVRQRWILVFAEGGWVFPLPTAYLYASVGLGASVDRLSFENPDGLNSAQEEGSFAWSLGGGVEAAVWPWLSAGLNIRGGTSIGDRVAKEGFKEIGTGQLERSAALDDSKVHPFIMLWGTITVHL